MAPPSGCDLLSPPATPSREKSYSNGGKQQSLRRSQLKMGLPYDSPCPATPRGSVEEQIRNEAGQIFNEALRLSRSTSEEETSTKSPSKLPRSNSAGLPKYPAMAASENKNLPTSPSKIPGRSNSVTGRPKSPRAGGSGHLPRSPSPVVSTPIRQPCHALDARIQLFEGVKDALPNLDDSFSSMAGTEDLASPPPTPSRNKRTSAVIEDRIKLFETPVLAGKKSARDLFTTAPKSAGAIRRPTRTSSLNQRRPSNNFTSPRNSKRNLLEGVQTLSARSLLMSPSSKSTSKPPIKRSSMVDLKSLRKDKKPLNARSLFMSPQEAQNNRNVLASPPSSSGALLEEVNRIRQSKRGNVKSIASQFKQRSDQAKQRIHKLNLPMGNSPTEKLERKKHVLKRGLEWNKRNNAWKNTCAMPLTPEFISGFVPPKHEKNEKEVSLIQKAMSRTVVLKDFGNEDLLSSAETTKDSEEIGATSSPADNTAIAAKTLIDAMEEIEVGHGEVIAQQGDVGEHFYIVSEGEVEIQVDDLVVGKAGMGDSFFDLSLVFDTSTSATVLASAKDGHSSTKLFRVDQKTFRGIMETTAVEIDIPILEGDDEDATETQVEEDDLDVLPAEADDGKSAIMKRRGAIRDSIKSTVGLEDLEKISILGEGQFGEVWLVEATVLEEEKLRFALKTQHKQDDIRCEEAEFAIRMEMEILWDLQHPFICDLIHTYEEESSIHMLLGLITGGELWDVIHKEDANGDWASGLASEEQARFYSLAIADTLDYMHSKRYVYRDLKPENVMIDSEGYPILVDFGFAKQLKLESTKTFTFCGTPNYVAPEIIKNIGHNKGVDHWALGVLIYEMLSGDHPFYFDGMDNTELFKNICEEDYYEMEDEDKFSPEAMDIFDRLMVKDASERLGSAKGDIVSHKWFNGLDIEKLRSKELIAPWIPGKEGEGENKESSSVSSGDEVVNSKSKTPAESEPLNAQWISGGGEEDQDHDNEDGGQPSGSTMPTEQNASNPVDGQWIYGEGEHDGDDQDTDQPWGTTMVSDEEKSESVDAQWVYGERAEQEGDLVDSEPWGTTVQPHTIPASSDDSVDSGRRGVNSLRPEGFHFISEEKARTWKVKREIPKPSSQEAEAKDVIKPQHDTLGRREELNQLDESEVEMDPRSRRDRQSYHVNGDWDSPLDVEPEGAADETSPTESRPHELDNVQASPMRRSSAIKSDRHLSAYSIREEDETEAEEIDETESSCSQDEQDPQFVINRKPKVRQPRHIPVTRRFKDTSSSKQRRATVNGALGAFIDEDLDASFANFANKLEY